MSIASSTTYTVECRGCSGTLAMSLSPEEAGGNTTGIRLRCGRCEKTNWATPRDADTDGVLPA